MSDLPLYLQEIMATVPALADRVPRAFFLPFEIPSFLFPEADVGINYNCVEFRLDQVGYLNWV